MGDSILYLDSRQSRAVMRALRKHGTVDHAGDISQALILMAEKDFTYFFVDADTPQAQAFLRHLEHDPTLPPPTGVVLLTCNDEEDCEAWRVDTFINRGRIQREIPYVFSHQKAERPDIANVLPIDRHEVLKDDAAGEKTRADGGGTRYQDEAPVDQAFELKQRVFSPGQAESGSARVSNSRYRYAFAALMIAALGLWLFAWGPLAANRTKSPQRAGARKVAAESGDRENKSALWGVTSVPINYAGSAATSARSAPVAEAAAPASPATAQAPAVAEQTPATPSVPTQSVEKAAAPGPAAVNHAPTVSISGPTQVTARQTATYTASGSDPDGDGVTYSWGGSSTTRCWSTPGLYTVSVTVTDSRGTSSGASVSVRVI
jgi:cytoskeletal protein RodZ